MSSWIKRPRAYRCWLADHPDLGCAFTLAINADKARYSTARSAFDAGYITRPSPHFVRCRRCPEHDPNPALREGHCSSADHLALGAAVATNTPTTP